MSECIFANLGVFNKDTAYNARIRFWQHEKHRSFLPESFRLTKIPNVKMAAPTAKAAIATTELLVEPEVASSNPR